MDENIFSTIRERAYIDADMSRGTSLKCLVTPIVKIMIDALKNVW